MTCRDARDALLDLLAGRLPPDAAKAVAAHIAGCAPCAAEAPELEAVTGLLRGLPQPRPPQGFWPEFMVRLERRTVSLARPRHRRLAWAARPLAGASLLVMAVVLAFVLLRPPSVEPPSSAPASVVPLTPHGQVAPYVTPAMRSTLPSIGRTVEVWQAGFGSLEGETFP